MRKSNILRTNTEEEVKTYEGLRAEQTRVNGSFEINLNLEDSIKERNARILSLGESRNKHYGGRKILHKEKVPENQNIEGGKVVVIEERVSKGHVIGMIEEEVDLDKNAVREKRLKAVEGNSTKKNEQNTEDIKNDNLNSSSTDGIEAVTTNQSGGSVRSDFTYETDIVYIENMRSVPSFDFFGRSFFGAPLDAYGRQTVASYQRDELQGEGDRSEFAQSVIDQNKKNMENMTLDSPAVTPRAEIWSRELDSALQNITNQPTSRLERFRSHINTVLNHSVEQVYSSFDDFFIMFSRTGLQSILIYMSPEHAGLTMSYMFFRFMLRHFSPNIFSVTSVRFFSSYTAGEVYNFIYGAVRRAYENNLSPTRAPILRLLVSPILENVRQARRTQTIQLVEGALRPVFLPTLRFSIWLGRGIMKQIKFIINDRTASYVFVAALGTSGAFFLSEPTTFSENVVFLFNFIRQTALQWGIPAFIVEGLIYFLQRKFNSKLRDIYIAVKHILIRGETAQQDSLEQPVEPLTLSEVESGVSIGARSDFSDRLIQVIITLLDHFN